MDLQFKRISALIGALLLPLSSLAQNKQASPFAVELSTSAYVIIGILLALSIGALFLFKRRTDAANLALKDITTELGTTRQRLVDTSSQLELSEHELKSTSNRYQGILFDANVGMFQMDVNGKCSYINTALQELSGLYPKKALSEGLPSAIHPDDRDAFNTAWEAFVQSNETFNQVFRFRLAKGRDVHVTCRANKVLNEKKEVESYIGWVSDVTELHEEKLAEKAITARYDYFVSETIEGHYQLVPESPIPLGSSAAKMAEMLMSTLTLSRCNETFAAMHGAKPVELKGKVINDLQGGCGPFKNTESLKQFINAGFKAIDLESVQQDPSGSRLNLLNSVVGIIEDNKLVAIWGSQRNITQQKREKAELSSQVKFMHRILNALPADIHVKDTRCRYVYASKKLADRTGIAQEEWVGKTIFEVMPGTPRDHDQTAINTMKTSKGNRTERPYEARGKSGWMETIQIPLVSDEGLVEGVVGLSLDISERKKKEQEAARLRTELDKKLKHTQGELNQSQGERSKAATSLSEAIQKLRISETEKTNREHEFKDHLDERKRAEETLRRSEQGLLARQQQLDKQLNERLDELNAETDKRKKWEELLAIKEEELQNIEEHTSQLSKYFEQETIRREQAETNLESNQVAIDKYKKKIDELTASREKEISGLTAGHTSKLTAEHSARTTAEKKLTKTEERLNASLENLKQLTEEHSQELEQEVAERKASAEKLIVSMDELDELRQQFNLRIEEETKSIKQELAKKQIREKALRQNEKDLESRIKELENTLQVKSKDFAVQIQAREGAEVQKQQIEQKMEQMSKRQEGLIDRETQKLNLNIAEIRLDEVKLRKRAGDLEREKEALEETLQNRNTELEKSSREIQRVEATLADTQVQLQQLTGDQSKVINKETELLRKQLEELQQAGEGLQGQLNELNAGKDAVEKNLELRNYDLTNAAREYRKVVDAYKDSQSKLKQLADDQEARVAEKTKKVSEELQKLKASEKELQTKGKALQERIAKQQDELNKLADNLKTESSNREEAQKTLKELQVAFEASQENADELVLQQTNELAKQIEEFKTNDAALQKKLNDAEEVVLQRDTNLNSLKAERVETAALLKETEARLANIGKEHQAELKRSLAEVKEVSRMNSVLVDELNDTVQQSLHPVVKTTLIMEKSDNLSDEQKRELSHANHCCRTLIDTMNYRTELTHLADGRDELKTSECDLHELMANVDRQFCHRAETKKLFFAVSFAQYQASNNVPKMVETDHIKLHKLLSILLGYAIEKTDKGRLGLHATRKSSNPASTQIAFELTYTSKESKDTLLSSIFDASDEATIDLKYGLTLARRYISMLGGVSTLEYRDAGITAFTVEFPFSRMGSEAAISSPEEEKQAGAA